jgi:hypothetical protein
MKKHPATEKPNLDFAIRALAMYSASLDSEGYIVDKHGDKSSLKVVVKRGRMRIESTSGNLYFSGSTTETSVCAFVEKFWDWEKQVA